MLEGYPLRKYTVKDWLLIILTSSLVLQLVITGISVKVLPLLPGSFLLRFQSEAEFRTQLVYITAAFGTILSLPLTLIVIKKYKIPFFNRKQLNREESFIVRGLTKADWKFLLLYIPSSFLLYSLGHGLVVSIFGEGEAVNQMAVESMFDYVPVWQVFLMVVIVAPIVEEVLFRGLILFSNGEIETSWFRVVISALLFGMVHNPTNISSLYTYVGMGLIFSYAAKRTNSLEASIIYHFLNNLIGFLAISLYL